MPLVGAQPTPDVASSQSLSSRLADVTRDLWASASSAAERLASDLGVASTTSALERRVRPALQKGTAALRWSAFGQSTLVPLPASWDDPRTLLALLNLSRVLYEEVEAQRNHGSSGSPSSPPPFPPPSSGGAATSASASASSSSSSSQPPPLPLPPVTLALSAAAVWRFFNPALLREVCLSPYCVLDRRQPGRLLTACLVHLDAPHLLTNLAALLPDAAALEREAGSAAFAAELGLLAAASSGLFGEAEGVVSEGVVRGESRRGAPLSLLGLPLPAQFGWAAQLALTHALAPDSSFAGHMAGVLAGIAHTYLLRPALRALLGSHGPNGGRPRVYGSGTLSGRPVSVSAERGRALRRRLLQALSQLGVAAAAIAIYAFSSQRRARPPLSNWSLR
ncbi:hypothetical protein GPECTOR_92g606 [Gonium pectorale]|uniref:Peptidase S54 rhomboid domain-containing protein n=1 Tax=Gonium pectorale TaxID=33097 RepID=A0A150G0H1_GONPE|nr:hypothetical protein GPECTOR_92g606 [Gonium pectorale]|eukprot:KXZ43383.1 hypothetical protein GPECTOR_92g606 [Gonium pectorale]